MSSEERHLRDLIASAKTAEDLNAACDLLDDYLASQSGKSRFVVSTTRDVAAFFGVEEQTVRQWRMRPEPMPGDEGAWPLREIVRWREAWLTQADLQVRSRQQAYDLAEVRLESERLELAEKQKSVLLREEVEHWAAVTLVEFRETVMQLKEKLTSAAPPELKDFVRSETDRHLRGALMTAARRLEVAQIGEQE